MYRPRDDIDVYARAVMINFPLDPILIALYLHCVVPNLEGNFFVGQREQRITCHSCTTLPK